jgi:SAM-dependent methyltransferase
VLIGKNLPPPLHQCVIRWRILEHKRFDAKYQIDTQQPAPLASLETSVLGAGHANRYEGTPVGVIRKLIRRLPIERHRFTFIDLGSGKGRVLLIAGQYPFKSVIGVEFSKTLHDIASSNIGKFVDAGMARTSVTSINADAGAFDFSPFENKIVFCYNPFGPDLMLQVVDQLESTRRQSGETIFLYLGPMPIAVMQRLAHFPVIRKGEFLSEFGHFERYSIYMMR